MLKRICAFLLALCLILPMIPTAEAAAYKSGVFTSSQGNFVGIDVSEHQGQIDWSSVRAAGIDFAIIRCGYGQNSTSQDDDWFRYNVKECNRVGIPFGLYLYNYATTTSGASGEADHAIRLINECKSYSYFRLPMYYDLEENSVYALANSTVLSMMKTFEQKVEAATGVPVGVYANTNWFNNKLTDSYYDSIPVWCAQYNYRCEYSGTYDIWQYTSSGSVSGISGRVDKNYARVDSLSDLYYGSSASAATATVVTDKSTYKVGEAIMVTANSNASDAWVGVYPKANDTASSLMWYWVEDYAGEPVNVLNARYTGTAGYESRTDNTEVYLNWGDGFGSYMNDNGGAYWGTLKAGTYVIGVYTGDGGTPLASKTITVSGSGFGNAMSTDKSLYYGQESEHIYVTASSDNPQAWVGLYKSSVTDYVNNPSYVWYSLYGRNNEVTDICWDYSGYNPNQGGYTWPLADGEYKIVMFKDSGYTVDTSVDPVKFIVGSPTLSTDKSTYCVKQPIKVTTNYTSSGSWIGLYGSSDTPGTQTSLYWYYTGTNKTSNVDIKSETNERGGDFGAGTYKVIQFADSSYSTQAASKTITVVKCTANSGSHTCKYCSATLTSCADNNNDHKCDTCSKTLTSCNASNSTVNSKYLKSAANCTSAAVYYKSCSICGGFKTTNATFTSGSKNTSNHVSGCTATWTKTATQHTQKYSTCGTVKVATANHSWSNGVCSVCSYSCAHADTNPKNHICDICGKTVSTCADTNPQDHVCDTCGKTGMGTHAGTATSHTCTYCGQKASECVDTNPVDGKCDICGVDVAHTCVDTNPQDHACDICGETGMGTHTPADGKHTCDYCGKSADNGCVDIAPKDHECDVCGEAYGDAHEAAEGSHNCAYCGEKVTNCDDKTGDRDHNCDVCDEPGITDCDDKAGDEDHDCDECDEPGITDCDDADGDENHNCDECDAENITDCDDVAGDGNHSCDECGAANITDCTDTDGDEKCDECGADFSITTLTVADDTLELGQGLLVTATSNISGDWVGVYPKGTVPAEGENEACYWYYVNGSYGGQTWSNGNTYNIFTAASSSDYSSLKGLPTGEYDVVLMDADYNVKHRITVTISAVADGEKPDPSLTVSKAAYAYGEETRYTVTSYKTNPWIGLYYGTLTEEGFNAAASKPASMSWQYVQGRNGTEDTWGALGAGDYTIILFDDYDNYTIDALVNFTVAESTDAVLYTDKNEYQLGDPILVTAEHDNEYAWVGLYKTGETYDPAFGGASSIFWYWVSGSTNPVDITAANNDNGRDISAGEYTVVLFSSDYKVVATREITIEAPHTHTYDQKVTTETYLKTAATCTDAAMYYYSCSCGASSEGDTNATFSYGEPNDHSFGTKVSNSQATPADCENAATYYVQCDNCDAISDTKTVAVGSKNDHSFGTKASNSQATPADCENAATYYVQCDKCDAISDTKTVAVGNKKDHVFDQKKTTDAYLASKATCTAAAKYYFSCTCGAKGTETFSSGNPIAHTYDKQVVDAKYLKSAATCTDAAVYFKSCACGAKGTETFTSGKAAGHKWTAATCEDPATCSVCKKTDGEALGHLWQNATCDAPKTCLVCSKTEGTAAGHKWADATCTAPKTCTACGKTEGTVAGHKWTAATCVAPKTCSVCGTAEGKALGHVWQNATCTAPKTCASCKATEGAALGHSWDAGVVTKEPTTSAEGTKTFTCSVCKATRTEDIPKLEASVEGVIRLAGADRYKTAFLAADMLKEQLGVKKFDVVVVASGTDFADALSGSYLAAVKNAPMLLVRNNKNTLAQVKDYIQKNLASGGTVYILGGVNAVPKAMETGLEGFTVKRLGGNTRYDTNLLILKEAGVGGKDILVCTGKGFADSLSASAAERPILLVKDSFTSAQKDFLKTAEGKFYIIGGTSAVSTKVEATLKSYGTVERLGGATRYETSVLVAKTFFDAPTALVLAYAQNFPDGLSGGALAAAMDAPLILTMGGKDAAAAKYAKDLGIQNGFVLGGGALIGDKAVKNIYSVTTITVK